MTVFFASSTPEVQLEARVEGPAGEESPRGLAIVAHPYGWLGGSLSDPVTKYVARLFSARLGLRAVRFNSRGVGKSQGRASWTGEVEAADYQAVAQQCIAAFAKDYPEARGCELIIAGYSAGSLYASAINPTRLPPQFNPTVSHILISYPLDKIWALSLFRSSLWDRRMRGIVGSGGEGGGSEQPSRLRRVLLVQGTRDEFTKDQSYQSWIGRLQKEASASVSLVVETVQGGSHFYNGEGHLQQLLDGIEKFVDREREADTEHSE